MSPVDLNVLRKMPVFADLDAEALGRLAALTHSRRCNAGDVIVQQDSPCEAVYVIVRGRASVSVFARDGRDIVLRDLGPDDFVGEISLFDGGLRSATVTAITICELVTIERASFLTLLEGEPKIAVGLLAVLASRLRRLTMLIDDLAGLPVRARLAKCLIGLVATCGQQVGPSRVRLAQRFSQEAIARRVAVTRESVNKHLRQLERAGILATEAGHLVVSDLARLRKEARLA